MSCGGSGGDVVGCDWDDTHEFSTERRQVGHAAGSELNLKFVRLSHRGPANRALKHTHTHTHTHTRARQPPSSSFRSIYGPPRAIHCRFDVLPYCEIFYTLPPPFSSTHLRLPHAGAGMFYSCTAMFICLEKKSHLLAFWHVW